MDYAEAFHLMERFEQPTKGELMVIVEQLRKAAIDLYWQQDEDDREEVSELLNKAANYIEILEEEITLLKKRTCEHFASPIFCNHLGDVV